VVDITASTHIYMVCTYVRAAFGICFTLHDISTLSIRVSFDQLFGCTGLHSCMRCIVLAPLIVGSECVLTREVQPENVRQSAASNRSRIGLTLSVCGVLRPAACCHRFNKIAARNWDRMKLTANQAYSTAVKPLMDRLSGDQQQ
jgi:hypothetical protein